MYYADFKQLDTLNGTGIRHSLFVSGCTHGCKGCFNASAWNFKFGKVFDEEAQQMILDSFRYAPVKMTGLSLLGGDPFDNVEGLLPFLKRFKQEFPDMNIWCWTGYLMEDLAEMELSSIYAVEMLSMMDVLIDGRFELDQRDLTLKFRGSRNQRIIDVQKSFYKYQTILLGE